MHVLSCSYLRKAYYSAARLFSIAFLSRSRGLNDLGASPCVAAVDSRRDTQSICSHVFMTSLFLALSM